MATSLLEEDQEDTESSPEDGNILEVPEEEASVTDTDDGGAIVSFGDEEIEGPEDEKDFYRNLADDLDQGELGSLALDLVTNIEQDKKAREDRDKQQEEGIKRTGLGEPAPGGADFQGASKVTHPMLTRATVEFESRAIAELMPPDGPVKDYIPGPATKARVDKARRKKDWMNWQIKVQMPEFRAELEQLLTQLPLGGSQYFRLVYDQAKKRPVPLFVPVDDVYIPASASSFYSGERITYCEHITEFELKKRVASGQYRDLELVAPALPPEKTKSEEATDKIEGKSEPPQNRDGLMDVWEVMVFADFEDEYETAPYLITLDPKTNGVLSVVRNWEESDERKNPMFWMADFGFIPWRGAYAIGLFHMIGGLSAAATGALRALLDSGHINNLPTLMKLKGANFSGQSLTLEATGVTEVEGGVATDDIRKLIMAVPFNPPSPVLMELLGFLSKEADGVVRTAMDNLSDQNANNMPVGTTLALIEQGMKVLASIHARLHNSMDMVIRILHRINRMYLTDEEVKDETGEVIARRKDFQGPLDVVPVSDPQVFSDVQRFAQMQLVAARAAGNPLYDQRKVEEMILERTKIPNAKDLLVPAPKPEEMNAVNENVAASLGRPIAAFPQQDHLAHLQTHLDFLQSPVLGFLSVIAPNLIPAMLSHIREHIVLWYVNEAFDQLNQSLKGSNSSMTAGQIMKVKDPETRKELDRLLAQMSPKLVQTAQQRFGKLPAILAQAQQVLQQFPPPPSPDPQVRIAEITQQIEQGKSQARSEETNVKEQGATQREALKQQGKQQSDATREEGEGQRTQFKEQQQNTRVAAEIQSREKINTQDNVTAMSIAAAEIENNENTDLSTGTGINPGS